jgi:hypothetical protein
MWISGKRLWIIPSRLWIDCYRIKRIATRKRDEVTKLAPHNKVDISGPRFSWKNSNPRKKLPTKKSRFKAGSKKS